MTNMSLSFYEKIKSIFKTDDQTNSEFDTETKITKPRLVSMDMAAYYKDKTLTSIFPNRELPDVEMKDYTSRSDVVLSKPVDVVVVAI